MKTKTTVISLLSVLFLTSCAKSSFFMVDYRVVVFIFFILIISLMFFVYVIKEWIKNKKDKKKQAKQKRDWEEENGCVCCGNGYLKGGEYFTKEELFKNKNNG